MEVGVLRWGTSQLEFGCYFSQREMIVEDAQGRRASDALRCVCSGGVSR